MKIDTSRLQYRRGALFWRQTGRRAGTPHSNGYRRVMLDGCFYREHRLIYYYHYGKMPPVVRHRDGDATNNHIENLTTKTGPHVRSKEQIAASVKELLPWC